MSAKDLFLSLSNPWLMVAFVSIPLFAGIVGTTLTLAGRFLLSKRKGVVETNVRAYEKHGDEYIEIYKLAREVELSLVSFYYVSQKKSVSGREFAVLAYELLRRNALQFIEKLDWRQHEAIIYLPSNIEQRCIRIRSQLFDGLCQTTFKDHIKASQFQDNRLRDGREINIWELEKLTKKGKPWQKIHIFKTRELINKSPFSDEKTMRAILSDINFVLRYLKVVFTQ